MTKDAHMCVYTHPLCSSSRPPPTISLLTLATGTFQSTLTAVEATIIIVSAWLSLSCCCGSFIGWTPRSFWPIDEIGVTSLLATRLTGCEMPLANWHPEVKSFKNYSLFDDITLNVTAVMVFFSSPKMVWMKASVCQRIFFISDINIRLISHFTQLQSKVEQLIENSFHFFFTAFCRGGGRSH